MIRNTNEHNDEAQLERADHRWSINVTSDDVIVETAERAVSYDVAALLARAVHG